METPSLAPSPPPWDARPEETGDAQEFRGLDGRTVGLIRSSVRGYREGLAFVPERRLLLTCVIVSLASGDVLLETSELDALRAFLGEPPVKTPHLQAIYRCEDCGAEWRAPDAVEKPPAPWRRVRRGFGGTRWNCGKTGAARHHNEPAGRGP